MLFHFLTLQIFCEVQKDYWFMLRMCTRSMQFFFLFLITVHNHYAHVLAESLMISDLSAERCFGPNLSAYGVCESEGFFLG